MALVFKTRQFGAMGKVKSALGTAKSKATQAGSYAKGKATQAGSYAKGKALSAEGRVGDFGSRMGEKIKPGYGNAGARVAKTGAASMGAAALGAGAGVGVGALTLRGLKGKLKVKYPNWSEDQINKEYMRIKAKRMKTGALIGGITGGLAGAGVSNRDKFRRK
jgi:hypothetical protein